MKKIEGVYLRSSTLSQEPLLQWRGIKKLKPSKNAKKFIENKSAWKEGVPRPVFEEILDLIKAGKVRKLYFWHYDRIYRNREKLLDFVRLCRKQSVELYSYNHAWLEPIKKMPSPYNEMLFDFMINMIGIEAEKESDLTSKRVSMAIKHTKKGTYSRYNKKWGRKPYDEKIIRRVKNLRKQGNTMREIAKQIRVAFKNKRRKAISKSTVHKILNS